MEIREVGRRGGAFQGLTVETGLYALIFAVAAAARLWGLGDRPLDQAEAWQALSAYRFYRGEPGGLLPGYSPPLLYGQLLAFVAFGVQDVTARLWPALAGAAVAISPLLFRRALGRWGALGAALLLAFSPSLLFLSRSGTGDMLALLGSIVFIAGMFRVAERPRVRNGTFVGLGLALALAAAPGGYTAPVALAAWAALAALWATRWPLARRWRRELLDRRDWGRMAALLAAGFAILSTGLLLHFNGFHGALAQLKWWLGGLPGTEALPRHYLFGTTGLYEFLPLALGALGIAVWWRRRGRSGLGGFLGCWAGLALGLSLLGIARSPGAMAQVTLPLALAGGFFIEELAAEVKAALGGDRAAWWVEGGAIVILAFVLLRLLSYAHLGLNQDLILAGLGGALLIALVVLLAAWLGPRKALLGAGMALLVLLGALSVRTAWGVSYTNASDPAEPLVVSRTSPGIRALRSTMEGISHRRLGDPHAASVGISSGSREILEWHLREFDMASVSSLTSEAPSADLLVEDLPGAGPDPGGPQGFVGQGFELALKAGELAFPGGIGDPALWRWLLHRQPPAPASSQRVILWAPLEGDSQ